MKNIYFLKYFPAFFLLFYCILLFWNLLPYWFNPNWTTDDARQQLFIFHEAIHPGRFSGDIIYEAMKGYFGPLAYWIGYGITKLTHDPIMTGHWVMAIQLVLTCAFSFLILRVLTNNYVACFGVFWLLHTRPLVHSMVAGLPRGWAGVVITTCLWAITTKRHVAIWVFLFLGSLLHLPSTFVMIFTYSLILALEFIKNNQAKRFNNNILRFIILAPLLLLTAYLSVKRPEYIGKMHTLEQASQMPEFSRDGGRFPFVPLLPQVTEITSVGSYAFMNNSYLGKSKAEKIEVREQGEIVLTIVCFIFFLSWVSSKKFKTQFLPPSIICFFVAVFFSYQLARLLAFNLYVPDRYLLWPLNIFWIFATSTALYGFFHSRSVMAVSSTFIIFSATLFLLGGDGLKGRGSFNTNIIKNERLFNWLKSETPENAVIGGHPIALNSVPLVSARRTYITEETFHPFYDKYFYLAKDRLVRSLELHYAVDREAFLGFLGKEDMDYFVFQKASLLHGTDKKRTRRFFKPYNNIVERLSEKDKFFYDELITSDNSSIAYNDEDFLVVDLTKLRSK
jgi:hypothetical protein